MEGFALMFGIPALGGQILRWGLIPQWGRVVVWLVLSGAAIGIMIGAGWSMAAALTAVVIASFVGGFAQEILPAIRANINGKSILALGGLALILFVGAQFMNANVQQRFNMGQWAILAFVLIVGILLAGNHGKKKD